MKDKIQILPQRHDMKISGSFFEEEDDFLVGKTPAELEYAWEDEE